VTADDDKRPEQIEREMEQTRESITEKVAALENQVLGTIHTATSTVSDTVNAVKEAVTTAPAAVKESVKETIAAVRDTVGSFSVSGCVRDNPWASVGTTTFAGFLFGYLLPGGGRVFNRPVMAKGHDEPAEYGQPGAAHGGHAHNGSARSFAAPAREPAAESHGMFGDLFAMLGREVRQLAEQAINTGLVSLKQAVSTQVPQMVDDAVHRVTDRVTDKVNGLVGGSEEGTTRVGGPDYTAAAPPRGL